MLIEASYICAFCGLENYTDVDTEAGKHQSYVEDCQTCCRPNVLNVHIDPDESGASIDAQPENG